MKSGAYQGYVRTLARMACSSRLQSDFEMLADVPDGQVRIDLKKGTALHSVVGTLPMALAHELSSWFLTRLEEDRGSANEIDDAFIRIVLDTSFPPTNRETLISFQISCAAQVNVHGREFLAEEKQHFWHNRPSQRSKPTAPPCGGSAA